MDNGQQDVRFNGIPTRILGATGVRVTVIGVGGYHMARPGDADLGIRIVRTAIDEGVNFMDNAWDYHSGRAERVMGQALRDGYRDRVFLMTKVLGRDKKTCRQQLEDSLRRLETDRIDLLQFHAINQEGEPARIFSEGAVEAALEARQAGKVRFIGFTSHRWPHLVLEMMGKDFAWDTVQMPVNLLDWHFQSFTREALPVLVERGIGIIGMKSMLGGAGRMLETDVTPREAIDYVLSLPIHTLVSGMDSMAVLRENLEIARTWEPLSQGEKERLRAKAKPFARDGRLEPYKTGNF